MTYDYLTAACWIMLAIYWLGASFGAKKSIRDGYWRGGIFIRLAILVVIILAVRVPGHRQWLARYAYGPLIAAEPARVIGVALCFCGVALAIWARVHLGRNWGMPMSQRQDPELVTSGPYALVRHPIYTGFLLAALGSALSAGSLWLFYFAAMGGYFIFSATREEKNMARQFPAAYPAYRARTKMLIPFVF